jgi:tetratricopeptide (TPR) repeat protein
MRLIRIAAALIVAGMAAAAVYRLAYLPWRADLERKRREAITLALLQREPTFTAVRARANIAGARDYLDRGIHNTGLYMVAAANYRLVDDLDRAAEMYRAALRYDRRPEIYFNLGMTELGQGRTVAAKEDLVRAALFDAWLIPEIADPIRAEVETAVERRRLLPWKIQ